MQRWEQIPDSDTFTSQMSGTKLLEVHGVGKELNPNLRPEKQHAMSKKGTTENRV